MRLIVCVDADHGLSFGGRRQSRDRVLRERILELVGKDILWMDAYSAELFLDAAERIRVSENCLEVAGEADWCFAELQDLTAVADQVHTLVIYCWNRHYPSDRQLPSALLQACPRLFSRREFAGSSHACITEEVYIR